MYLVERDKLPESQLRVGWFAERLCRWGSSVWLDAKLKRDAKKQMNVIETLSIGGQKQLVLVRCGAEQFLVGTGTDSVHTIVRVGAASTHVQQAQTKDLGEAL